MIIFKVLCCHIKNKNDRWETATRKNKNSQYFGKGGDFTHLEAFLTLNKIILSLLQRGTENKETVETGMIQPLLGHAALVHFSLEPRGCILVTSVQLCEEVLEIVSLY